MADGASMNGPLLPYAVLACIFAVLLSIIALRRRRTDGWLYAAFAAVCTILALGVGGGLVFLDTALFRRGLLAAAKPGSIQAGAVASAMRDHEALLESAARIALWCGGAALGAVALAVGVIAPGSRGARRWVGISLCGLALAMFFVTWRAAHVSDRALLEAIDDEMRFALARGLEGCDALEDAFDAANHARISLDRDYPRARDSARACVDQKIAQLDHPDAKRSANAMAELERAAGQPSIPDTPATQLLATCSLPITPSQRADLERRAAAEH